MSWLRSSRSRSAFIRLLSPHPNYKVLDVGAGSGRVAALVQRTTSCEVHALEPSEKKVGSMQRKHPGLKTCLASAGSIPYPDGFFDRVYSTMAMHHFPDQAKSLAEMARVLRPDGVLLIVDISPTSFLGRLGRFFENTVLRSRLKFLAPEEVKTMLVQSGFFEVTGMETLGSAYAVQAQRKAVPP